MKKIYPVIFTFTHDEKDTVMAEIPDLKVRVQTHGLLPANANEDTFISTVDIDFEMYPEEPEGTIYQHEEPKPWYVKEPAVAYDVIRKK